MTLTRSRHCARLHCARLHCARLHCARLHCSRLHCSRLLWAVLLWAWMGTQLGCQEWLATADPTVHVGETETVPCVGCHKPDYNAAKSPDHAGSKLPTACETCHVKTSWTPAKWDHQTWPLTGKHVETTCVQCHSAAPDRNVKPPRACEGCHLPDYNAAKNPDHQAGSYPKSCQSCHTPVAWKPAGMTNHKFPITSGKHNGVPCASCHVQADDFKAFTCMSSGCHPKGEMDDKHLGEVGGYVYQASACLNCHPDGKD